MPVVSFLMIASTPVSWPIARALDWALGEGHAATRFDRRQIKTLINLHLRESRHRRHSIDGGMRNRLL